MPDDRRQELLDLVNAALDLAHEIDHPVWADLSDARNVLDDELAANTASAKDSER